MVTNLISMPLEILEPDSDSTRKILLKERLYLEFADLPPTSQAITSFANKYGCLKPRSGSDAEPSYLWEWRKEIKRLQIALRALARAKKGSKSFKWIVEAINKEVAKATSLDNTSTIRPMLELRNGQTPYLCLRPKDLLSALWLQLMLEVAGNKKFKQCSECKKIMLIAPGVNRPERKTCGEKCRKRASRKRMKQRMNTRRPK